MSPRASQTDEARNLKAYGELPETAKINETDTFGPGEVRLFALRGNCARLDDADTFPPFTLQDDDNVEFDDVDDEEVDIVR